MSDGTSNAGANVATLQVAVVASGAVFNTFAVGNAAQITCAANPTGRGSLLQVAQLGQPAGQCYEVGTVADLPNILPTVLASTLSSLELSIDGGAPLDISASAAPALPQNGPANVNYSTSLANLAPGSHELCVTANGSDAGGTGNVTECVDITVNAAPLPDAGGSYSGDEGSPIALVGSVVDSDGPGLVTGWTYSGPATCFFSAVNSLATDITCQDNGLYLVTLTADDGLNAPVTSTTQVTVANVAPTVDAGLDQSAAVSATVNLSGSFSDPAGAADEPYTYEWDFDGDTVADFSSNASYGDPLQASTSFAAAGSYVLTLTVTDKDGDSSSDTMTVFVNSAPICSAVSPSVASLWTPNHALEMISILGVTDPDGDPVSILISSIFQDEPTNGLGDGDVSPDGFGIGTSTAQVRAERSGTGNGRFYHISFTASDPFGATCSGIVQVTVPKNQGKNGATIDDGALFDSTLP